jgi:hypothetical protein
MRALFCIGIPEGLPREGERMETHKREFNIEGMIHYDLRMCCCIQMMSGPGILRPFRARPLIWGSSRS